MKRTRYRRLRKCGNRWHGKDAKSVFIVRYFRQDGTPVFRWQLL